MSLYDELDVAMLGEESTCDTRRNPDRNFLQDNLADELGNAFEDETYDSDTLMSFHHNSHQAIQAYNPVSSKCDYTGDEWGDPAEDSDPDGRFQGLNGAIHTFCEVLELELDSAYMSDDASTDFHCETVLPHRTDFEDRRTPFVADLQALKTQGQMEHKTLRLIYEHEVAMKNVKKFMSEVRELVQTHVHGTVCQMLSAHQAETLIECFEQLQESLPSKVEHESTLSLSLLEAETNALIADLYLLGDSLQECKQISYQAQRILRSVKDACDAWKRENNQIQEAQVWLVERDTDNKLKQRIFSKELVEIKSGFEAFCVKLRNEIAAN